VEYVASRDLTLPGGTQVAVGEVVPGAEDWPHLASWVPHWLRPAVELVDQPLIAQRRLLVPGEASIEVGQLIPKHVGGARERKLWITYGWVKVATERAALVVALASDGAGFTRVELWTLGQGAKLDIPSTLPRSRADVVEALRAALGTT
jgi:hypothetical protein